MHNYDSDASRSELCVFFCSRPDGLSIAFLSLTFDFNTVVAFRHPPSHILNPSMVMSHWQYYAEPTLEQNPSTDAKK